MSLKIASKVVCT